MIFVGYEPWSKAYQAYDPWIGRVHITHDAVFDELTQWNWCENVGDHGEVDTEPFEIEVITTMEYQLIPGKGQAEQDLGGRSEPSPVGQRLPSQAS
jgi:hypothetical protein